MFATVKPRAEGDFWLAQTHGASPALLFDPGRVRRTWRALEDALPGVTLYYADKSNNHSTLLNVLADMGASFDVASAPEVTQLISLGVGVNRMIHTHPIKTDKEMAASTGFGVETFVVDNIDELWKLVPYRHDIRVMLRLAFVAPDAPVDLSRKFGAQPADALDMLAMAGSLGLNVDGLCFHVGSQAASAVTHAHALNVCIDLAAEAARREIADITRIDIGGGFPAQYGDVPVDFEQFCAPIREAMTRVPEHISLLAEPGRAISAPSMTLVARVIGRSHRDTGWWYYLDDGVYGAQSGRLFDHIDYPMVIYTDGVERSPAVFAGPTCDSIDRFGDQESLPILAVGDVIVIHEMGAYTVATACHFNGVAPPVIIDLEDDAEPARKHA